MIEVTNKSRKTLVRSRDKRTCISCTNVVSAKESDVYEFDFSNKKKEKYAILCNRCKEVVEELGMPDDEVPNLVARLLMEAFLRQTGGLYGPTHHR